MRQVIIAISNKALAAKLKAILEQSGSSVRAVCGSGAQALQTATAYPDGGVLLSIMRLPDMSIQQLIELLPDTYDSLLLVTAEQRNFMSGPGIYKLVEPINAVMLADWVKQLLLYRQVKAGLDEAYRPGPDKVSQPPRHGRNTEDQKLIEQAKYLLMNRKKITEQEAHRYLQKRSMQSGLRLVDLARQIVG